MKPREDAKHTEMKTPIEGRARHSVRAVLGRSSGAQRTDAPYLCALSVLSWLIGFRVVRAFRG
jgi:hypothetical protein